MNDLRRSSSTYTESLFLHVVKRNLFWFFLIFFLSRFFFVNIHDSQDSRWKLSPYILSTIFTRFADT